MKEIKEYNNKYFEKFSIFWKDLRRFFYVHKTLFDFIFLLMYAIEQIALVIGIMSVLEKHIPYVVGVFMVIFFSTWEVKRICMDSIYNYQKDYISKVELAYTKEKAEKIFLKKIIVNLKARLRRRKKR